MEKKIGYCTSGTISPVLKKAISMAYVEPPFHEVGQVLNVVVRGKSYPATVSKLPFVPTSYKHE